jgi:hypothetical protein
MKIFENTFPPYEDLHIRGMLFTSQAVWFVGTGCMDHPSRTKSHPAGSLSSRQPGRPPCWPSLLGSNFGIIGHWQIRKFLGSFLYHKIRKFLSCANPQIANFYMVNPQIANPQISLVFQSANLKSGNFSV